MIKNIIFDIDGVLVDVDRSYLNFLKENYQEYADISYEDLPVIFPIKPDDGAFRIPREFSKDFCDSPYYCDRPLFDDTMAVLWSLKKKGLKLFTLSATREPIKKRKWLEGLFADIFDEIGFSPAGVPKNEALRDMLKKHSMGISETIFIDDRFYNIDAGIATGVHTVRMQPGHSLPLPERLSHIKSFRSLSEFEKYVDGFLIAF